MQLSPQRVYSALAVGISPYKSRGGGEAGRRSIRWREGFSISVIDHVNLQLVTDAETDTAM